MRRHSCRPRDPHPTQAPPTAPTLLTLLAVIATLTGAAAPAAAQGVLRPLLTVHASVQPPTTCRFMSDVETFVSTTGFTQQVAIGGNECQSFVSWLSGTSTVQASPTQVGALRTALDANHVGLQGGACALPLQFLFSGSYEITWYGRNLRRSDVTVYLDAAPSPDLPACPAEVCQILQAFIRFEDDVFHESDFIGNCPAPPP